MFNWMRPGPLGATYAAAVAILATTGFVGGTPAPILLAAALTLPASTVAMPAFYVVVGFLGLVPGAGHSDWFVVADGVVGVTALSAAALVDAALLRTLLRRREHKALAIAPRPTPR